MLERVLRLLVCPACHASLDREFPRGKLGGRVRMASLACRRCRAPYGVQEGVGLFAEPLPSGAEWRPDPGLLAPPPDDEAWNDYLGSLPPEVPRAYARGLEALAGVALEVVSGLVVDLATSRGNLLRRIAAEHGGQQLLLGTDPEVSSLFLTQAALKRERHYTGVSLLEMDATHWPLRDAGASTVVSFYGPSILPQGRRVLREAARVLRPDGTLAFTTLLTGERTLSLRQASRKGTAELFTEERLRKALDRSGLRVEAWQTLAGGGAWPRSPQDPLPLEGDPWSHVLVRARRRREA